MSKPLFDDVGQELKEIAAAAARRIMVAYALLGIAFVAGGLVMYDMMYEVVWIVVGVIAAIWSFLYGYNKAHLESIELYAYGELVYRVTSLEKKVVGKKSAPKAVKPQAVDKSGTPLSEKNKDGSWKCAYCDHLNPAGADWCEECGVEAIFR